MVKIEEEVNDYYIIHDYLVIARTYLEEMFSYVMGSSNTVSWQDDNMFRRFKKLIDIQLPADKLGKYAELFALASLTPMSMWVMRAGDMSDTQTVLTQIFGDTIPKRVRKRRPQFVFSDIGIPVGSELHLKMNQDYVVTVDGDPMSVLYNGELVTRFSVFTKRLIGALPTTYLSPMHYWLYHGKLLAEYYDKKYPQ
jgi:hypothetical protein